MSMLNSEAMMRYLYKEMSPEESSDFLSQVNNNPDLQDEFTHIKEGFETLENVQFSPSSSVIEKIMQYGAVGSEGLTKE